jgi:hypothetical protein
VSARTDAAYAAELAPLLDRATSNRDGDGRTVIDRIRNSQFGVPGSRPADTTGGRGAVAWCWEHEREITACRRRCKVHDQALDRCRADGRRCYLANDCEGEPVDVGGDTTGEVALRPDHAAADLAQVENGWRTVRSGLEQIARIYTRYPAARTPTGAEVQVARLLGAENDGAPGCSNCARTESAPGVPRWVPPRTKEPTDVAGLLDAPRLLCRWCYDHVVATEGMVPNLEELEQHHDGKRVICPHPRAQAKAGR